MEWMVPVNEMLKDDITKLNYTLIPPGFQGDVRSVRIMQESLSKLIDMLGEQSAAAQGLNKVITTAEKLRNSPTHILYLLKDPTAKKGKGEVIGLLKVGRKHLFLFDSQDKVCEVEPLCVLDFFVLSDRQRHGYGRLLFDHMLQDMETSAQKLAIDGPSPKMEQFLSKNYGLEKLVRQSNNFAVSPSFFNKTGEISKSGRTTPVLTPAVGRFAAPKPPSAIANVIHGGGGGYYESNNGRVSGRATPDADVTLTEKRSSENHCLQKQTEKPAQKNPTPDAMLEVSIPELQRKLEKLEVDVRPTERPSSLKVGPPPAAIATPSPAGSAISRRDSQLTERGFFDVKFYHNKLW
ncbi:unnamed protein product [Diatraea saccharalis]|uniref:Alpha-tubulin N-acetyltransferase n=1 Tax=Diatraea saccharalis TaxID=40085 RepID=A0A9N9QSL3_9NEOP|nr:unnamed protein product [Diatraea saccharalis]